MKILVFLMIAFTVATNLEATVTLPRIFGNNMVLQRNQPIPVWGWADPGEKITVQFNQQTKNVTAAADGNWKIQLEPESAGGPYQFVIKGTNLIEFKNVLVGEVWICSGQSNMEWNVRNSNDAEKEIASSDFPMIRHIKIPNAVSGEPVRDIAGGRWQIAGPKTTSEFTAVGYFFARKLFNELHVPVGIINSSWGGTMVETWISKEAFMKSPEFSNLFEEVSFDDLTASARAAAKDNEEKIAAVQGSNAARLSVQESTAVDLDDSGWPVMSLPATWEEKGFEYLDGVVWFRKSVELPVSAEGKPAVLSVGAIDDMDETYINGDKVGGGKSHTLLREYAIPAGVLKPGKNVIAIKITDIGGEGGIRARPEQLKLSITGDQSHQLAGNWAFRVDSVIIANPSPNPNSYPTLLFNAMINPLVPYGIRGALWYQGESNAGRAFQYKQSFPLMINDWRTRWKQGDFPFYFVQLAGFNAGNGNSVKGSAWAELREAQSATLALRNTGMAVTLDIGESGNIHPKNKQDVGGRLAAIALNNLYGKKMAWSGPVYKSMKIAGGRIMLSFTHASKGFLFKDRGDDLKGFEIAGEDKRFYPAIAAVEKDNIAVWSDSVAKPVAVRYGWADDMPEANLYNKEGFPASPFRTDTWRGITESAKYEVAK